MHTKTLETFKHHHDYAVIEKKSEQRTLLVLILTAITMVVELIAGKLFGSMSLQADGWHMGTHVAAFFIAVFAYRYAKKHARNPAFTFGTGKVIVLGGFASAVALAVVAVMMAFESSHRLVHPQEIHFDEAIAVAILGLIVNLVCAVILQGKHHYHDESEQTHHHHDHNIKAAYYHVLADALTSLLAIIALFAGKFFGWNWLDPLMGIAGALVITHWAYGLQKETSLILLDSSIEENKKSAIKEKIESDSDNRISDFHLWKVGPDDYAAIISLVTHYPKPTEHYKKLIKNTSKLSHITIEINQCSGEPCIVQQ